MNLEKVQSSVVRFFFAVAFLLLLLAVVKGIVQVSGGIFLGDYTPGRLVEFGSMLLAFVVAILLRQIRDLLATSKS